MITSNAIPLTKFGALFLNNTHPTEDILKWARLVWQTLKKQPQMEGILYQYNYYKQYQVNELNRSGAIFNVCGLTCSVDFNTSEFSVLKNLQGQIFFIKRPFVLVDMTDLPDDICKLPPKPYDQTFVKQTNYVKLLLYYINQKQKGEMLKCQGMRDQLKACEPVSKCYQITFTILFKIFGGDIDLVKLAFQNVFKAEVDIHGPMGDSLHKRGDTVCEEQLNFIANRLTPEIKKFTSNGKLSTFMPLLNNINVFNEAIEHVDQEVMSLGDIDKFINIDDIKAEAEAIMRPQPEAAPQQQAPIKRKKDEIVVIVKGKRY